MLRAALSGALALAALTVSTASAGVEARTSHRRPLAESARASCMERVEQVYVAARRGLPLDSGPALDTGLDMAGWRARARQAVEMSAALGEIWHRPLRPEQLQAEMDRMARRSQHPGMLGAVFAALDNDPFLVAECLARPRLASRLARDWYSGDSRLHADVRRRAEADLAASGSDARLVEEADRFVAYGVASPAARDIIDGDDADGTEVVEAAWPKVPFDSWWQGARLDAGIAGSSEIASDAGFTYVLPELSSPCTPGTWEPMFSDLPDPRTDSTAVWTGAEMIIWGGYSGLVLLGDGARYDPATDTWTPVSKVGAPSPRRLHTAVWTGSEMIVWGGQGAGPGGLGARYDPALDTWSPVSEGPGVLSPRSGHTAVWTGTEMIIWGGHDQTEFGGSRYAPATDSWTYLPVTDAPSPRFGHTAVWTGTEMIVWGGSDGDPLDTGGSWNAATDTWTEVPWSFGVVAARTDHTAVWTGSEMIVWGGQGDGVSNFLDAGARFNPATDIWTLTDETQAPVGRARHTAIWTGSEMIVWGGISSPGVAEASGGRYDPVGDSWQPTTEVGAPRRRWRPLSVWTGSEMIVWGAGLQDGGRYDPASDSWVPVAAGATVPAARGLHSTVWTGAEMIVWGGNGTGRWHDTGGRYDPAVDDWSPTALTADTPMARSGHSAVWTGSEMIVWGGRTCSFLSCTLATGGRYDPALDQWTPTSTTGAPSARSNHRGIWTGREMIVAGGFGSYLGAVEPGDSDIGRYDPLTDTWLTLSTPVEIRTDRMGAVAAWTGDELLLWGGAALPRDSPYFNASVLIFNPLNGGRYDPRHDSWQVLSSGGVPASTAGPAAVWDGTGLQIWGGQRIVGRGSEYAALRFEVDQGGRYDPATGLWSALPEGGEDLSPRHLPAAAWTGAGMIVWGGRETPTPNPIPDYPLGDGAFVPAGGGSWSPVAQSGAPTARGAPSAVFTGASPGHVLVWGGDPPTSSGAAWCAECSPVTWYGDDDGDGRGVLGNTVEACTQPVGFAPAADDCDDADPDIAEGLTEICGDLKDNDCNGIVDDAAAPGPAVQIFTAGSTGGTLAMEWSHAAGAQTYDIIRGSLAGLRSGGGLAASSPSCLADGLGVRSTSDATLPATSGDGFYYLVQGDNCAGDGTVESGGPSQTGDRDPDLLTVCP